MITYESSGVSIERGDELVRRLKEKLPGIGGFGGLFPLASGDMKEPVLVASTDGVGTKLLVAIKTGRHSTIGLDLVAMVVNDLIVCGAKPLFFLDYFATGKLELNQAEEILSGIIEGCRQAGCVLLGGETAEMPGMYGSGHYDLAGFGVGIVDRAKIMDGSGIVPGDIFIGVASSGLHSNGYSLARKVLMEKADLALDKPLADLGGETPGDVLLRPTHIYVRLAEALKSDAQIKGIAHITGGGIPGNLNRILPGAIDAEINGEGLKPWPAIFDLIRREGPVPMEDMLKTFNMGMGLILAASPDQSEAIHRTCRGLGYASREIGRAIQGSGKVKILDLQ